MPRQVSLLSCWDVFVCRACLGDNCSVEEKLEFKGGIFLRKRKSFIIWVILVIVTVEHLRQCMKELEVHGRTSRS